MLIDAVSMVWLNKQEMCIEFVCDFLVYCAGQLLESEFVFNRVVEFSSVWTSLRFNPNDLEEVSEIAMSYCRDDNAEHVFVRNKSGFRFDLVGIVKKLKSQ